MEGLTEAKLMPKALTNLKRILEANPSIQVIIDLHRDGIGSNDKALTNINGRKTARIMFFNGLSRNSKKEIKYLKNDNLFGNLSFSLKLKLKGNGIVSQALQSLFILKATDIIFI